MLAILAVAVLFIILLLAVGFILLLPVIKFFSWVFGWEKSNDRKDN